MKLIGLMLVRNEEWAFRGTLKAALKWCDGVYVLLDRCTDLTQNIIEDEWSSGMFNAHGKFIRMGKTPDSTLWMEMDCRQKTLEEGRDMGGTHFAIIDGDEILTANLFDRVRGWFESLNPGEIIELPRVSSVTLNTYWADNHEHANGAITLGFRDRPDLAWRPRGEMKYHFHGRPPTGSGPIKSPLGRDREAGGIIHLQYANRNRMRAKSLWYMLNERIRWPERKTPAELNTIYGAMLDTPRKVLQIPSEWWGEEKELINPDEAESWHLEECRKMVQQHGREILNGLDTRGFEI